MKCLVIFLNLEKNHIVMSQNFGFISSQFIIFSFNTFFYIVSKDSSVLYIKDVENLHPHWAP